MPVRHGECGSARHVDHFGRCIDQIEHCPHVDHALADRAIHHAEQIERAEQLRQQRRDEHHVARREITPPPPIGYERHPAAEHQIGDQRLPDVEPCQRIFGGHRSIGVRQHRRVVALPLALLRAEIFDRFEIEQRIDRMANSTGIEIVHPRAQGRAPIGHHPREPDIDHDHRDRRRDQSPAEAGAEDIEHQPQFQHRRRDIEQHEVQHRIDALGPALDDFGDRTRAAFEMEAQRELVEVPEHARRQPPRRVLPDALEYGIPQIIEQGRRKARAGITEYQGDHDPHRTALPLRHPVDRPFQRIGARIDLRDLRQHDQRHRPHDPQAKDRRIGRPQIGQEALERRQHGPFGRGRGGGGIGWHLAPM